MCPSAAERYRYRREEPALVPLMHQAAVGALKDLDDQRGVSRVGATERALPIDTEGNGAVVVGDGVEGDPWGACSASIGALPWLKPLRVNGSKEQSVTALDKGFMVQRSRAWRDRGPDPTKPLRVRASTWRDPTFYCGSGYLCGPPETGIRTRRSTVWHQQRSPSDSSRRPRKASGTSIGRTRAISAAYLMSASRTPW